jgi:broad specificity phosphatase PhoE
VPVLVLVRHGQSSWNRRGLVQGQTLAPSLTPRGWAQAAAVAWRLRDLPLAGLVSSDQRRAEQTVSVLATLRGVSSVREPVLRERALGVAEGRPAPLPSAWSGFWAGRLVDPDAAPPGGESVRQLLERTGPALARLAERAADRSGAVVVVTHGGVVRAARALVQHGPVTACTPGAAWPMVHNGAVVVLRVDELLQALQAAPVAGR